jgi:hypothetical protein
MKPVGIGIIGCGDISAAYLKALPLFPLLQVKGVADMASAIRAGRPHRASGEPACHVLEVMAAFQAASDSGRTCTIHSRPERPAPLPAGRPTAEID